MKQVGMAVSLYLAENNDQYPTNDPTKKEITGRPPYPKNEPATSGWIAATQPYVKNASILRCSEDQSKAPRDVALSDLAHKYPVSYTINGWSEYELKLSNIPRPHNWILLGERNNSVLPATGAYSFYFWTWQGLPIIWPPTASPDPTQLAAQDLHLDQHDGGSFWLYGDGHVQLRKLPQLWGPGKENAFWPTRD